jgi:hypothetical protein
MYLGHAVDSLKLTWKTMPLAIIEKSLLMRCVIQEIARLGALLDLTVSTVAAAPIGVMLPALTVATAACTDTEAGMELAVRTLVHHATTLHEL